MCAQVLYIVAYITLSFGDPDDDRGFLVETRASMSILSPTVTDRWRVSRTARPICSSASPQTMWQTTIWCTQHNMMHTADHDAHTTTNFITHNSFFLSFGWLAEDIPSFYISWLEWWLSHQLWWLSHRLCRVAPVVPPELVVPLQMWFSCENYHVMLSIWLFNTDNFCNLLFY